MAIDEKSIYVVDGGDYSIYCLGYTQARAVTNDIMRADPWGGIPFVLRKDLELSLDDRGNVVMSKSTLDKILFLASDELPESQTTSTEGDA
tara:strand:+ start:599 stop:871 length:273 start_codon:yes stop_codon:yes gene_type:complete